MIRSLVLLLLLLKGDPPGALEPLGRLDHPPIREASGIVQSRRYPGIFWVHNDSGNAPALFAVRRDGTLVREYRVAIPNIDWEDIATDGAGHLYLGEIGNNGGLLPVRAIYRLDEPDPAQAVSEPLKGTTASYYQFVNRAARFDAEGLFIERGRATVIAKYLDGREAELFAVPLDPPARLLNPAVPANVGHLPGFREPATGADLSRDGRLLVVCSYQVARVYERSGDSWELLSTVRYPRQGIEAVCWEGNDLILASEDRSVSRISERTWRRAPRADSARDARSRSPRIK